MGLTSHFFFPGCRQEVNSTWYSEIEKPYKSREKHYSLVLYILKLDIDHRYTELLQHSGDESTLP